jgi:hypothetical protein
MKSIKKKTLSVGAGLSLKLPLGCRTSPPSFICFKSNEKKTPLSLVCLGEKWPEQQEINV